jgi:hypothetical protein
MADKLFVIAIGGTGMRCLESFVHLSAIGMFDNQEINILTLDTDQANGNLKRVWDLIDLYNAVKTPTGSAPEDAGGKPSNNTFFSAKLNLTKYWPSYSGDINYKKLSNIAIKDEISQENIDLASLFLEEPAQTFNLAHGYRAQTHLGSQLIYHAILDSAIKSKKNTAEPQEKALMQYIEGIVKAGKDSRVFILGSIFGGTGASSIPVIPVAFKDAYAITKALPIEAKFGASLLTEYFEFTSPNDAQKKKPGEGIVADANYFTLNSQAALQFYENDPTVEQTYKYLYNVGWPVNTKADFSKGKSESETITGGKKQLNPCHVTELMCAFAAYDFFTREDFPEKKVEYVFRTVNFDEGIPQFEFKDFLETDKKFKNRLTGFYAIALFTLVNLDGIKKDKEGMTGWINRMSLMKYTAYENVFSDLDKKQINDYFKAFLFNMDSGSVTDGWLYQIRNSFTGQFLLPNSSFDKDINVISKINPGVLLKDEKSQWGMGKSMFGKPSPKDVAESFNDFVDEFIKTQYDEETQNVEGAKMKLMAQLFNTISKKQQIEEV